MKKQTAVDFLQKKLTRIFINDNGFKELFEKAKRMEREQIENAYQDGIDSCDLEIINERIVMVKPHNNALNYYIETYGGEQ